MISLMISSTENVQMARRPSHKSRGRNTKKREFVFITRKGTN